MVAVAGIAGFCLGLAISEYYNRRIQRIITGARARPARSAAEARNKPGVGPYTEDDLRLMRAGYRVGRRMGGEYASDNHVGD